MLRPVVLVQGGRLASVGEIRSCVESPIFTYLETPQIVCVLDVVAPFASSGMAVWISGPQETE